MSTPADLRRIALALPEAYEDLHRGRPTFRVEKRIFATLGVSGNDAMFARLTDPAVATVKLDRDDQLNMCAAHPGAVAPTEAYGHHGYTYLDLPALDGPALALIVRLAWTHVAPKRLVKRSAP